VTSRAYDGTLGSRARLFGKQWSAARGKAVVPQLSADLTMTLPLGRGLHFKRDPVATRQHPASVRSARELGCVEMSTSALNLYSSWSNYRDPHNPPT